jgi:hypothetical protein
MISVWRNAELFGAANDQPLEPWHLGRIEPHIWVE